MLAGRAFEARVGDRCACDFTNVVVVEVHTVDHPVGAVGVHVRPIEVAAFAADQHGRCAGAEALRELLGPRHVLGLRGRLFVR